MYINFFPGNIREAREITVSDAPAYGMSADLGDLLDSMLTGSTASLPAAGVKAALEDGALLGAIAAEQGFDDDTLQQLAEELHAAL